jgi:hypothetical protein
LAEYFENFPTIEYQGRRVRDITRRNRFTKAVDRNPLLYLPYTVKDDEKPEDIAYRYYGSVEYTWLVYLANKIVDPYHDWPKTERDFNNYIAKKYEAQSGLNGFDVVDWTKRQDNDENILYYYLEVED